MLREENIGIIGFLAWAQYVLIDLISICKHSQLCKDNIRFYKGLPLTASVILEDHFMTECDQGRSILNETVLNCNQVYDKVSQTQSS